MSDEDNKAVNHEGRLKPGFYLLFTDGNKNPRGSPRIGGLLKYRKRGRWRLVPGGTFSEPATGESIDQWEYEALLTGMKLARSLGAEYVWAYMDRRAIVEQINNTDWKVRPKLRPRRDEVWRLCREFTIFRLSWIPREMNEEADERARSPE